MKHLSVKVPDYLYQELEAKAQTLGVRISDLVRDSIRQRLNNTTGFFDATLPRIALNHMHYSILSYCLLEAFIENAIEDNHQLCKKAQEKARQILMSNLAE